VEQVSLARLEYFAVIVREGSLVRASKVLGTTHSNLSMQMKALEDELGVPLFERTKRRLSLTPVGAEVLAYADEVVRIRNDVIDATRRAFRPRGQRSAFRVGVVAAIPKTLAFRLLEPAIAASGFAPLIVRQESPSKLHEELATGRLHLVLSDGPPEQGGDTPLFGHLLGSSEIVFFGTPSLAERHEGPLPSALAGAPLLLPARGTWLRTALERWLGEEGIQVHMRGEFDDAATMRVFGLRGVGIFPARAALRAEVEDLGGVVCLGEATGVKERYYAISVEKRVEHPAVSALITAARERLARRPQA
jgi:LysR family transcriptional regulator, transcriptional activator of nhaA